MRSKSPAELRVRIAIGVCLVIASLACLLVARYGFTLSPLAWSDSSDPSIDLSITPKIRQWHSVQGFSSDIAQFETVFWEPDDTTSLRAWLTENSEVNNARVLEVGVGTGIVSLAALCAGAETALATDINPMACLNARYNAERLELSDRFEVREVSSENPAPFAVIQPGEQFDFIISNPPWEDAAVDEVAAHALYDPQFALLDGLLADSQEHLKPGGKMLLAYGARTAIQRILESAASYGWTVRVADSRNLESLPEVFLPGMLLILEKAP